MEHQWAGRYRANVGDVTVLTKDDVTGANADRAVGCHRDKMVCGAGK